MAPQNESFYGSLRLGEEKEETQSRVTMRRVAIVSLAVVAVLGVAFFAQPSQTSVAQTADALVKDASLNLPDCECATDSKCKAFSDLKATASSWIDATSAAYKALDEVASDVRLCKPKNAACADHSGRRARSFKTGGAVMAFCRNKRGCINMRNKLGTANVCGDKGFCVPAKAGSSTDLMAHTCVCDKGYHYAFDKRVGRKMCININECSEANFGSYCHKHSTCKDLDAAEGKLGYECTCFAGFEGTALPFKGSGKWGALHESEATAGTCVDKNGDKVDCGCKKINTCKREPTICENGGSCFDLDPFKDGENAKSARKYNQQYGCKCDSPQAKGFVKSPSADTKRDTTGHCTADVNECKALDEFGRNKCQLNTLCVNTIGSFMCECDSANGWEKPKGVKVCETSLQSVAGRMMDKATKKMVDCIAPGELVCEQRDYCAVNPCLHGGECVRQNYDGTNLANGCNHDEEDALKWATKHGKTIQDYKYPVRRCYTCDCSVSKGGWKGDHCQHDIDECKAPSPHTVECDTNAYCVNTRGSHTCTCNNGWTGDGYECVDANDCVTNPCSHGGTCVDCGTLCFTCDCVLGWTGVTCGTDWNECLMGIHTCNDAATCVNTPGSYACKCDVGYTGNGEGTNDMLDAGKKAAGLKADKYDAGCININDCKPDPCKNGGECTDLEGTSGYMCKCKDGWRDENCDTNKNECNTADPLNGDNLCSDNAVCVDANPKLDAKNYKYRCKCNYGFRDPLYQDRYGNRLTLTAKQAASKTMRQEGFLCTDADDCTWKASDPEVKAGDRKVGKKCASHGYCSDLGVAYSRCMCDEGWHGADCELDIDECTSDTHMHECRDNTVCVNTPGSYKCICETGFDPDGSIEEVSEAKKGCRDHDDCAESGCINKKKCVGTGLGAGRYKCTCEAGWKDMNCDHDVDECREGVQMVVNGKTVNRKVPCAENAKCVNTPGSFFCRCKAGYKGNGIGKKKVHKKLSYQGATCVAKTDLKDNAKCAFTADEKRAKKNLKSICNKKQVCIFTPAAWKHVGTIKGTGCEDINDCAGAFGFDVVGKGKNKKRVENKKKRTPLYCDKDHGECQDTGPNRRNCKCDPGWGGPKNKAMPNRCSIDIDECKEAEECTGPAGSCNTMCHKAATCSNTIGSYTCKCNKGFYDGNSKGGNIFEDGKDCIQCWDAARAGRGCPNEVEIKGGKIVIGKRMKRGGACTYRAQMQCEEVNECANRAFNNCHDPGTDGRGEGRAGKSTCTDLPSSEACQQDKATGRWLDKVTGKPCMFKCECKDGFFGTGHGRPTRKDIFARGRNPTGTCPPKALANGCQRCTKCLAGYREVKPCTSTSDRVCERILFGGKYLIQSDADGDMQCLAIRPKEEFPSRVNYGNAGPCGYPVKFGQIPSKYEEAVWQINALFTNYEGEQNMKKNTLPGSVDGTNYYTITHKDMVNGGKDRKCLSFLENGQALYPSLKQYGRRQGAVDKMCGWSKGKAAFIRNKLSVWKIQAVKYSERKYIFQNNGRKGEWECLAFEDQGVSTNPSRYMWGHNDKQGWCGIGSWHGEGKKLSLLNNQQAVFILTAFSEQKAEPGAITCNHQSTQ